MPGNESLEVAPNGFPKPFEDSEGKFRQHVIDAITIRLYEQSEKKLIQILDDLCVKDQNQTPYPNFRNTKNDIAPDQQ